MKIVMSVSIAGNGFALTAGEITDRFSDAEAGRMIERGMAVEVTRRKRKVEKAVLPPVETATEKG